MSWLRKGGNNPDFVLNKGKPVDTKLPNIPGLMLPPTLGGVMRTLSGEPQNWNSLAQYFLDVARHGRKNFIITNGVQARHELQTARNILERYIESVLQDDCKLLHFYRLILHKQVYKTLDKNLLNDAVIPQAAYVHVQPKDIGIWTPLSGDPLRGQKTAAACADSRLGRAADERGLDIVTTASMIGSVGFYDQNAYLKLNGPQEEFATQHLLAYSKHKIAIDYAESHATHNGASHSCCNHPENKGGCGFAGVAYSANVPGYTASMGPLDIINSAKNPSQAFIRKILGSSLFNPYEKAEYVIIMLNKFAQFGRVITEKEAKDIHNNRQLLENFLKTVHFTK